MTASKTNPKVDGYLKRAKKWQEEMTKLRAMVLATPLTEELKWGKPCYTWEGKNVVLIMGFKESCIILFCKGALLKDPEGLLVRPTENTQAARQLRISEGKQIAKWKGAIKTLLEEAIAVEKAGLDVTYKKVTEFSVPEEFQAKLVELPKLKTAFEALTPGRRRAYLLFFSGAKQSKTREARVEKCIPDILAGKGMND